MKIIFSRKGFDSSFGGVPSPIFENGQMMSLPIPGGRAPHRFQDLQTPVDNMGPLVSDLTKQPIYARAAVHLDPDLDSTSLPRKEGWRASLGQVRAAQTHLEGQGVGKGDLFLFFGWFREVEKINERYQYQKKSVGQHTLFGYLQIGEMLPFGAIPDQEAILKERPWLYDHPHIEGERASNNTVYVASSELVLPTGPTGLPGAGAFDFWQTHLQLTAPNMPKSRWKLPNWFGPESAMPGKLSYHKDPKRWENQTDGSVILSSVAKGQEFVMDLPDHAQALEWIKKITSTPLRGAVLKPQLIHAKRMKL